MTPQQITSIQTGLSEAKLATYEQLGFTPNSQELVRAYLALQDVSAHLFLPLQMLELSLRNNLHHALHARFPSVVADQYWFDHLPVTQEGKNNVIAARKLALRDHPGGYGVDDVVCSLTFGFWVYMLDRPYRAHGPNNFLRDDSHIIFPGRNNESIATIFDLLKSVNRYRNRLYHHEPVWKHKSVHTFQDALRQVNTVYETVLRGLNLVNPSKKILMDKMSIRAKFDACRAQYNIEFQPKPAVGIAVE